MTVKKLDLICEKLLQQIEKTATDDFYNRFSYCKTVDDVFDELGVQDWGDALYEVGYSLKYSISEVENFSPRFCRLQDKVIARLKENEEKIMKMAKLYKA